MFMVRCIGNIEQLYSLVICGLMLVMTYPITETYYTVHRVCNLVVPSFLDCFTSFSIFFGKGCIVDNLYFPSFIAFTYPNSLGSDV